MILPEPSRSMCLKMRYQDCLVGTGSILVTVRVGLGGIGIGLGGLGLGLRGLGVGLGLG